MIDQNTDRSVFMIGAVMMSAVIIAGGLFMYREPLFGGPDRYEDQAAVLAGKASGDENAAIGRFIPGSGGLVHKLIGGVFIEGNDMVTENVTGDISADALNRDYYDWNTFGAITKYYPSGKSGKLPVRTEIQIPDKIDGVTITRINSSVFKNQGITAVTFPVTLERIDNNVFEQNALTSVTLPSSVTHVGNSAFRYNQITTLALSNNLSSIGMFAFNTNKITGVVFPDSVTTIGIGAFSKNLITVASWPKNMTHMTDSVFDENKITQIVVPSTVRTIGPDVFRSNGATSVNIHNQVTTLGDRAFAENNLTSVTIPNSVTSLGQGLFMSNKFTTFTWPARFAIIPDNIFEHNLLTSFMIPSGVTTLGSRALGGNKLTTIEFPTTLTTVAAGSLGYNGPYSQSGSLTYSGPGRYDVISNAWVKYDPVEMTNRDRYDVVGGVITRYYPKGKSGTLPLVTQLNIPSSINNITITGIGNGVFKSQSLTQVVLPGTFKTIGNEAFMDNALSQITLPPGLTTIGDWAFAANNLGTITIPNTVTSVGMYAFRANNISSFVWPSGITTISAGAFYQNNFTTLTLPSHITSVGIQAFFNSGITELRAPGLVSIGESAFANNKLKTLSSAYVPKLSHINPGAFRNNLLESVTLPSTVGYLTQSVFADNHLSSVVFSTQMPGLRSIYDYAFANNPITSVNTGSITYIGPGVFSNTNISSLVMGSALTQIGGLAFESTPLTTVTFVNNNMSVPSGLSAAFTRNGLTRSSGPLTYSGAGKYDVVNGVWVKEDPNAAYFDITSGGQITQFYPTGRNLDKPSIVFNLTIPSAINGVVVNSIGSNAFYQKGLSGSLSLPQSLTSIGSYAFSRNSISSVILPSNLSGVGSDAFSNNIISNHLIIPGSLMVVSDRAFFNNRLASLSIGSGVRSIGVNAFGNNSITGVTIPSTVTSLGASAFSANKLTTISIPSSVTSMGTRVFANNTTLRTFEWNTPLTTVQEGTFENCGLTSFSLPTKITRVAPNAFASNRITNLAIGSQGLILDYSAFDMAGISKIAYTGTRTSTTMDIDTFVRNGPNMDSEGMASFYAGKGTYTATYNSVKYQYVWLHSPIVEF